MFPNSCLNVIPTNMQKSRRRKFWTEDMERIFLKLWADNAEELRGSRIHVHIHERMAREMCTYGCIMSAADVKTKIDNLTAKYKKEKAGASPYTWCLFQAVNDILGEPQAVNASEVVECQLTPIEEHEPIISPSVSYASTCSCAEGKAVIGNKLEREIYHKRWKNLFDRYVRESRKSLENTQAWANQEMLKFFNEYAKTPRTISDTDFTAPEILNESISDLDDNQLDIKHNIAENYNDECSAAKKLRQADILNAENPIKFEEGISKHDVDPLDMKYNFEITNSAGKNNSEHAFNFEDNKRNLPSDDNELMMYALAKKMRRLPMHVKVRLQEKFLQDINNELLQLECNLDNSQ